MPCPHIGLDAGPEAYHNWAVGAFAVLAVIRDQVMVVKPVAGLLVQRCQWHDYRLGCVCYAVMQVMLWSARLRIARE